MYACTYACMYVYACMLALNAGEEAAESDSKAADDGCLRVSFPHAVSLKITLTAASRFAANSTLVGLPASTAAAASRDTRTQCRHGLKCYTKRPEHFVEYAHPGHARHAPPAAPVVSPVEIAAGKTVEFKSSVVVLQLRRGSGSSASGPYAYAITVEPVFDPSVLCAARYAEFEEFLHAHGSDWSLAHDHALLQWASECISKRTPVPSLLEIENWDALLPAGATSTALLDAARTQFGFAIGADGSMTRLADRFHLLMDLNRCVLEYRRVP